jgi:hypothetical protein
MAVVVSRSRVATVKFFLFQFVRKIKRRQKLENEEKKVTAKDNHRWPERFHQMTRHTREISHNLVTMSLDLAWQRWSR